MPDKGVLEVAVDLVTSVLSESASLSLVRDALDDVKVEVMVDVVLSPTELSDEDESGSSSSSVSESSEDDLVVGKAEAVNADSVVVE